MHVCICICTHILSISEMYYNFLYLASLGVEVRYRRCALFPSGSNV